MTDGEHFQQNMLVGSDNFFLSVTADEIATFFSINFVDRFCESLLSSLPSSIFKESSSSEIVGAG
uniref:Uncharacterized protein n=1 Tax=Romanomermis culicivorax TaxID=13658 RepID=A0A915K4S1_ROMCU